MTLESLITSGRAIDLILVFMVAEGVWLTLRRLRLGRGPTLAHIATNLGSGAAIMLAVRAALTDADWTVVAGFLMLSFVMHGAELALRLRDRE